MTACRPGLWRDLFVAMAGAAAAPALPADFPFAGRLL
jgi:hypothetical protein